MVVLVSARRQYNLLGFAALTCFGFLALFSIHWHDDIAEVLISEASHSETFSEPSLAAETKDDVALEIPKPASTNTEEPGAAPALPAESSATAEGHEQCELFFTSSYLEHTATHQQPYCDAQSPSAFQCFTAPRLVIPPTAGWGTTDPLCVAQGVSFRPGQGSNEFGVQCKLRDLAAERASSPAAAEKLEGFRDRPTDWGWYWGDTGVGASLNTWRFEDRRDPDGCTRENSNHEWVMLMRRDSTDTHNIWHKLMEILQARHSLEVLRVAVNPATGAPWLSEEDANAVQLVFDDDREELLEPLWEIVTGRKPIRKSSMQQPSCLGNVILPLPGCGSPFWSALLDTATTTKHCPSQTLLTTFVSRVLDFYGIEPRPASDVPRHPAITIVDRKKNRKLLGPGRWLAELRRRYPDSDVRLVDFADMTVPEQIRLAQSTDVLVGHHGAAMTHVLFMTPGSTAVEILPRLFDQHGFRALAEMRGVAHVAGRCLFEDEYVAAVTGRPLAEGWTPPSKEEWDWQTQEWAWMTDNDFLGLVDDAVRTQMDRLGSDV